MTSVLSVGSKITLFVDSLESGGAQRQIVVLANVLHQRGYKVSIVTYYPGNQLSTFIDSPEITLHFIPRHSRFDLAFLARLVRHFRNSSPNCIISYLSTTNFWARVAGRMAGITHIITSERSTSVFQNRITALRERLLAPLSSFIVTNSQLARVNLLRLGIPREKLKVIYNGLDLNYFSRSSRETSAALRSSLGIVPEDFLILLPGRISEEKNHLLLVGAAVRFSRTVAPITVLFAGNEFYKDLKDRILARIKDSGETSRFHFLGPRSDMPMLYSAADVVVLPSLWEGFPNVIVEAMACGTPVIASDVSDNALIIQPGISGFVFPSNDEDLLLNALTAVFRMPPEERRQMIARGIQRASDLCSLNRFGDKYVELIEKTNVHS